MSKPEHTEAIEAPFSAVTATFMLLMTFFTDIFQLVASPILPVPALGIATALLSWGVGTLTWAIIQTWLIFKGERAWWFLAGSLVELVGSFVVNWLPIMTITLAVTIILANTRSSTKNKSKKTNMAVRAAKILPTLFLPQNKASFLIGAGSGSIPPVHSTINNYDNSEDNDGDYEENI